MQNRLLKKAFTKISLAGGTGVGKTSGCVKEGVGVRMKEERWGGGEIEEGDSENMGVRTEPF